MSNANLRKNIIVGSKVRIVEKQNQSTGKLTDGIVNRILTNASEHPYGIKVELQNGRIGRVKEIESLQPEKILIGQGKRYVKVKHVFDKELLKGESHTIEYKSSFKFNVDRFKKTGEKTISKDVEKEVSITVVAFSMASGGTLLIGVKDNGDILGIDEDIRLSSNQSRESFERQLWQSLKNYINNVSFLSNIQIFFSVINSKEICEIKVPKASEPITLKDSIEECYVRMGNRSEKIGASEFMKHCKNKNLI